MSRIIRLSLVVLAVVAGLTGFNSTQAEEPSGNLTVEEIVAMSSISTAEEYSVVITKTKLGAVLEYNRNNNLSGHQYNWFTLEPGVSFCAEDAAPWLVLKKMHILIATDETGRFCGMVPEGWDPMRLDYPSHAYFSLLTPPELAEAIGWTDVPLVI